MTGLISAPDRELLLRLLRTPTVNPLERSGEPSDIARAQRLFAEAARESGLRVVQHHAAAPSSVLDAPGVPSTVREAAADEDFLAGQPNLVLRLGPRLSRESTVMFNVHLDTVAGLEPVRFDGERFTGRGAIDAKGPAVALLAGIREAVRAEPAIGRDLGIIVQAVAGEEGGAMGTFGTRPLVDAGFLGRLNVFCEPTGMRYLTRSTAAATALLRVDGAGAIDDRPDAGHNASVLLGFLAQHLAKELDPQERPGRLCVAGLHTGELHNRVYGSGGLLLNLSYESSDEGAAAERDLENSLHRGLSEFTRIFGGTREFARTAADAASITELRWLKRGLPALRGSHSWTDELLERAGIPAWPAEEPAFTCDAIWMAERPDTGTVVLGPGSLENNNAHAEGEYAELAQLQEFAATVASLLSSAAAETASDRPLRTEAPAQRTERHPATDAGKGTAR